MSVTKDWLSANVRGFSELSPEEVEAISDFCLLWSLFEEWVLNNNGNITSIRSMVSQAQKVGNDLELSDFREAIKHFTNRYFADGHFTDRFDGLRFKGDNGGRREVQAVLAGEETSEESILVALLIIVYRLRNNLFHGEKWSYNFKDQFDNFRFANEVLRNAIELFNSKGVTRPEPN